MMTKNDYENIAKVFAAEYAIALSLHNTGAQMQLRIVVYSIADLFYHNPNFNRKLFYWSCHVDIYGEVCGYQGCDEKMHLEKIRNASHPDYGNHFVCCWKHGSQYVLEHR